MSTWAYIYEHPGTDPVTDRVTLDRHGHRTLLVPVPTATSAPDVADRLVTEDGVTLIELCGGFSLADAAAVATAVGDRAALGHVTFAVDAVPRTASYIAAFEEPQPRARPDEQRGRA
jgi:hypothetical protein